MLFSNEKNELHLKVFQCLLTLATSKIKKLTVFKINKSVSKLNVSIIISKTFFNLLLQIQERENKITLMQW